MNEAHLKNSVVAGERLAHGHALAITCLVAAAGLAAVDAFCQSYPAKPVRIVTGGVGGSNDLTSRLVAQGLTGIFGSSVIVENQKDGAVASESVAKSAPDGYTLLLNGSTLWLMQFLRSNVAWDPERDFAAITLAVRSPNMVVVHPSLPVA